MNPLEPRVTFTLYPELFGGWKARIRLCGVTAVVTIRSCSYSTIEDALDVWGGFVTDIAHADPETIEVWLAVYDPITDDDPHELLNAIRASRR